MARKKRMIIPVFIPFGGCPHQCVFCDQTATTGAVNMPSLKDVRDTIDKHLATWKGGGNIEAAFYGGSFTALPDGVQREYLEAAHEYVISGRIGALRVSTRPDCISTEIISTLKSYGVATVELGAQSMDDGVLRLSGRGHTSRDTAEAARGIKEAGLRTGIQFMPGLPGDTRAKALDTAAAIIGLKPDFTRVYPSVVLKDTPLYKMYLRGEYLPWGLDEMVEVCAEISRMFKEAGIPVIRMGLQHTEELKERIAAGPYHPSFRQLVEEASVTTAGS